MLKLLVVFVLVASLIGAESMQEQTFSRDDRDYRPLQFGKRDSYRPLQFGKREYRPLQFGKRSGYPGYF